MRRSGVHMHDSFTQKVCTDLESSLADYLLLFATVKPIVILKQISGVDNKKPYLNKWLLTLIMLCTKIVWKKKDSQDK